MLKDLQQRGDKEVLPGVFEGLPGLETRPSEKPFPKPMFKHCGVNRPGVTNLIKAAKTDEDVSCGFLPLLKAHLLLEPLFFLQQSQNLLRPFRPAETMDLAVVPASPNRQSKLDSRSLRAFHIVRRIADVDRFTGVST